MEKKDFGFKINENRQINLDEADRRLYRKIALIEPSVLRCIFCGACSSTCTVGNFTHMSFRLVSLLLRRGLIEDAKKHISKCMLCGKCSMVCPRDINIRHIMLILKKEFSDNEL
jgi:heterodisulfide reductase subunit C